MLKSIFCAAACGAAFYVAADAYSDAMTAGGKALAAKKYDEAVVWFKKAGTLVKPDQHWRKNDIIYYTADALEKQGKHDEAIKCYYQEVPEKQKGAYHTGRINLQVGYILREAKKEDEALAAFQKAADSGAKNWIESNALTAIGQINANRKKYPEAEAALSRLCSQAYYPVSTRVNGFILRSEILRRSGKAAEGYAMLDTADKIEKLPPDAKVDIAVIRSAYQSQDKRLNDALKSAETALEVNDATPTRSARAFSNAAWVNFQMGKLDEAKKWIDQADAVQGAASWAKNPGLKKQIETAISGRK